jgi:DNA-binding NtrC family response regulator
VNHTARVLLISDDRDAVKHYRGALEAEGYHVTQTESYVDTLGQAIPDPDVIVLCDLAFLSYPGQYAPVIRIPDKMSPDDVVAEVHRKIALRAATQLTAAIQPA